MIGINDIELLNELEKFDVYKRDEDVFFDEVKSNLNILNSLYNTDNTNDLIDINLELEEKLKVINNIHNNYKVIINSTIDKYIEAERKVIDIFSDINVNVNIKEIE